MEGQVHNTMVAVGKDLFGVSEQAALRGWGVWEPWGPERGWDMLRGRLRQRLYRSLARVHPKL
eukprot:7243307-Alexandrium_andersonii.AAC.1